MPAMPNEKSGVPASPQDVGTSAWPHAEPPPRTATWNRTKNADTRPSSQGSRTTSRDADDAVGEFKKADVRTVVAAGPGYGFFSKELKDVRRVYLLTVTAPVILVILLMWICLPVYWGALANATNRTAHLEAWYVNRDPGSLGTALWGTFSNTSIPGQLGWRSISPQEAGSDTDVVAAILDNKAWIAVVVEENATNRLALARQNGDVTYDPRSAVTVYYAQARQENAIGSYVLPITTQLLQTTLSMYATLSVQQYLTQVVSPAAAVNDTALRMISQAPRTISPGVSYNAVNLRPYTSPIAQAVTLVGNIYLIIFAFVAALAHAAARATIAPCLAFPSYLVMRVAVPLIAYIPLSMSYALINLAFDLPFGAKYSYGGGFMIAFLFLYLGMASLGLAVEAMITVLTPRFVPFFLFFMIIFNLSPTVLPVELMHPFYRYGLGFPISNLSQAIRTLIFNVHSDLGRNAGVLIAWIILSCITTVLFTIWLRSYELDALLLLNPPARKVEEGSGSGSVSVDGDGEVGKGV